MYKNIAIIGRVWYIIVIICWLREMKPSATPLGVFCVVNIHMAKGWRSTMKLLEDRILQDGKIGAGDVLKVDSFLNHQIDVAFLCKLGEEFRRLYKDEQITKILTIEASGIGIACLTAQYFNVPVVFAKKTKTNNIYADVYTSKV